MMLPLHAQHSGRPRFRHDFYTTHAHTHAHTHRDKYKAYTLCFTSPFRPGAVPCAAWAQYQHQAHRLSALLAPAGAMPLQQTWRPFIMMALRLAAEVASSQVVDANPMTTPMAGCTASGGQNGAALSGWSSSMSWRSGYCCRCACGGGGAAPVLVTIPSDSVNDREIGEEVTLQGAQCCLLGLAGDGQQ